MFRNSSELIVMFCVQTCNIVNLKIKQISNSKSFLNLYSPPYKMRMYKYLHEIIKTINYLNFITIYSTKNTNNEKRNKYRM
jgi:hypothetical protein